MTTNNFCFYLQNRLIQTSFDWFGGGQRYNDTSPISIPWSFLRVAIGRFVSRRNFLGGSLRRVESNVSDDSPRSGPIVKKLFTAVFYECS